MNTINWMYEDNNSFLSFLEKINIRDEMKKKNELEFENGSYHENETSVNDAKMNLK